MILKMIQAHGQKWNTGLILMIKHVQKGVNLEIQIVMMSCGGPNSRFKIQNQDYIQWKSFLMEKKRTTYKFITSK